VGLGRLLGLEPLASFPRTAANAAIGVGWGLVATLPPLMLLALCVKCPLRPFAELARVVDELLVPLFRDLRPIEMAVIALLAGLGEDTLFRGIVQSGLDGWIGGKFGCWIALGVAAALFALLHCITRTYALLAGALGLYLGWVWMITENLLVPITAHAVYDFLALIYMIKVRKPPIDTSAPADPPEPD